MTFQIRVLPEGVKVECSDSDVSMRLGVQGEWKAIRHDERFYRRGVDGSVHGANGIFSPGAKQAVELHQDILPFCRRTLEAGVADAVEVILQRCLRLPIGFYHQQEQAYQAVYPEGVPVLPPDRYRDVVFPVTTGCPNGQCTFCAFYRGKPFSLLRSDGQDDFSRQVKTLFPKGVAGREGIFLGSANALALPFSALGRTLDNAIKLLGMPKRGIACFGDADYMGKRTVEQWEELQSKGLRQVVLGLETGAPDLRKTIGKSDQLWKTERLAHQLKQAGIAVGFTVLTGFIAAEHFPEHRKQTDNFLQALELEEEDRVYISPWFTDGALQPEGRAFDEAKDMKQQLQASTRARVTAYSSHNFYYFS
ncbi:radical SAM protein [Sansalvadorimonas verongulae]|uniref:radical SAM protein n=1 Tax=Sansalvadorimonas verongulae TaxID=2172824 RepID=UPI0012BC228F|nr:radical SAM protein [Sansalvadorimonas verongulae]MTI12029.1 radical SAM protein [Sansalvadorimonas verongulae]